MNEIIPKFQKSLFCGMSDSIPDIAEFGIDSILSEGILKNFPLVSALMGVKNVAQNLYDRNLLRQTLAFVKELNNGKLDGEKKEKYKKKIEDDPKKAEAELGRVLIILNRTIELDKSKILASIFREYINEKIDWKTFCEFSDITDGIFLNDINDLKLVYSGKIKQLDNLSYRLSRLNALGLVKIFTFPAIYGDALGSRQEVKISEIGGKYCELIFAVSL